MRVRERETGKQYDRQRESILPCWITVKTITKVAMTFALSMLVNLFM